MKQLFLLLAVGFLGYSIGKGNLTAGKVKKVAYITGTHVNKAYNEVSQRIVK
jgi:hypothetical protein